MNPRDYLELANEIVKVAGAARCRSAISRSYYAAFNVGVEALRKLGFAPGKGAAGHGEVAHCFMNSAEPNSIMAGQRLAELHTNRIRVDYHLERTDVEHPMHAARLIEDARFIIDTFDQSVAGPQRAQIQSAIAAWRKSNGYP